MHWNGLENNGIILYNGKEYQLIFHHKHTMISIEVISNKIKFYNCINFEVM